MRTFNFKANNHRTNSDSRFEERVEVASLAAAVEYALGLQDNWGCRWVDIYEDGELLVGGVNRKESLQALGTLKTILEARRVK